MMSRQATAMTQLSVCLFSGILLLWIIFFIPRSFFFFFFFFFFNLLLLCCFRDGYSFIFVYFTIFEPTEENIWCK